MQGLDWEILWDFFLHDHACIVMMVYSRCPQAMLFLFLTCYREVRSCYQLLWFCRTGDANLIPRNPLPPCLNGDSGWNLLVAVMWCSTRPRQRQSTPSLCSVTAGVDTEKPCSLTGAERTPLPIESLHTWKLNLIFAGWSSWALASVQKSLGSQGVTAFITFCTWKESFLKTMNICLFFSFAWTPPSWCMSHAPALWSSLGVLQKALGSCHRLALVTVTIVTFFTRAKAGRWDCPYALAHTFYVQDSRRSRRRKRV